MLKFLQKIGMIEPIGKEGPTPKVKSDGLGIVGSIGMFIGGTAGYLCVGRTVLACLFFGLVMFVTSLLMGVATKLWARHRK